MRITNAATAHEYIEAWRSASALRFRRMMNIAAEGLEGALCTMRSARSRYSDTMIADHEQAIAALRGASQC